MWPHTLILHEAIERAPVCLAVVRADGTVKFANDKCRCQFDISGVGFELFLAHAITNVKDIFGEKPVLTLFGQVADVGAAAGLVAVTTGPYQGQYRLRMTRITASGVPEIAPCIEQLGYEDSNTLILGSKLRSE